MLETLERRALVERTTHPDDRRSALVAITKEGIKAMERLLPELHRTEVAWTSALTERQQATLIRQLGLLQRHLQKDEG